MLRLTFKDGATAEFPFGPDSQLTVSTPDGVNGLKYGSWGELVSVETVDPATDAPDTAGADPAKTAPKA